jgi:hypothetical protein
VDHRSSNCPNEFPPVSGYRTLMQADVDHAKKMNWTVAVVSPSTNEEPSIHPVAAVLGSLSAPTAYVANNGSSVIIPESESDNEVSHPPSKLADAGDDGDIAPLHGRHFTWPCRVECPKGTVDPLCNSLIDPGSHLVLINAEFANVIAARCHKLCVPEVIDLALLKDKEPNQPKIELHEWIKLKVYDPSGFWSTKTVRAVIARNLCCPIILGLPFLSHNSIIIDTAK